MCLISPCLAQHCGKESLVSADDFFEPQCTTNLYWAFPVYQSQVPSNWWWLQSRDGYTCSFLDSWPLVASSGQLCTSDCKRLPAAVAPSVLATMHVRKIDQLQMPPGGRSTIALNFFGLPVKANGNHQKSDGKSDGIPPGELTWRLEITIFHR